jgi:hypothetical protein
MAAALATAMAGTAGRSPIPAAAALVLLGLVAIVNVANLDGLGGPGWRSLGALAVAGRLGPETARRSVDPPFSAALDVVQREMGPADRVFSSDGRFRFFFPGRASQAYPARCEDLRGYRVFVLGTDPVTSGYMERHVRVPADPAFWRHCAVPRLIELGETDGLVIFRVEPTRAVGTAAAAAATVSI